MRGKHDHLDIPEEKPDHVSQSRSSTQKSQRSPALTYQGLVLSSRPKDGLKLRIDRTIEEDIQEVIHVCVKPELVNVCESQKLVWNNVTYFQNVSPRMNGQKVNLSFVSNFCCSFALTNEIIVVNQIHVSAQLYVHCTGTCVSQTESPHLLQK
jgi:hypothetical protein